LLVCPEEGCKQWPDAKNERVMGAIEAHVVAGDQVQIMTGFMEEWRSLKLKGPVDEMASKDILVSLTEFIHYFLVEWNAGMELFAEEDFIHTLRAFKEVAMSSIPRDLPDLPTNKNMKRAITKPPKFNYPQTQREASDVIFNGAVALSGASYQDKIRRSQILSYLKANSQMMTAALSGLKGETMMFMLRGGDEEVAADDWFQIYAACIDPLPSTRAQGIRGCRGCKDGCTVS